MAVIDIPRLYSIKFTNPDGFTEFSPWFNSRDAIVDYVGEVGGTLRELYVREGGSMYVIEGGKRRLLEASKDEIEAMQGLCG